MFLISLLFSSSYCQNLNINKERIIRYYPENGDIVIQNGEKRFNRALYGINTAFRVETGDLPEVALFLPNMGGNIKFGIIKDEYSKWLTEADNIEARYRPGMMIYHIKDALLGNGILSLYVIPLVDAEGVVIKAQYIGSEAFDLIFTYGGASGTRFYRNGDIGADPESVFYLKPEYCNGDKFEVVNNHFTLHYTDVRRKQSKMIRGILPEHMDVVINDANLQSNPMTLISSLSDTAPVLSSKIHIKPATDPLFFGVYKPESININQYTDLAELYSEALMKRDIQAEKVVLKTPDPFLNTLGSVLVMAADAVWDGESYMHGAVAWRMPLNGWRGAYMGDPLGWGDRSQTHFRGYALAQYTEPDSGPNVPDPKKNLARQEEKKGNSIFTKGYISRNPGKQSKPHHYDMNLVFVDQVLRHLDWTADTAFLKEIWPLLVSHLEWEKRCFDGDNDGLYDAYCCIWASDAIQYSGGAVTYSSAYNYFANLKVAKLAEISGENPDMYYAEAERIKKALNENLWLPDLGKFGEYKDLLGNQRVHPAAGVWTYYHSIDSKIPDPFQAYQMTQRLKKEIPHIPIQISNREEDNLYTISTSNWMPYTWSVNNVALAEVMHTCLAYWQSERSEEAYLLWKSALMESMYLGSSPGNIQQLSYYDTFRGELYRDFADPIAMVTRSLTEGLFGITPDALNGKLYIKPGLPVQWDSASLFIPDLEISYKRIDNTETYSIIPHFKNRLNVIFKYKLQSDEIEDILINNEKASWTYVENAIDNPEVVIECGVLDSITIKIITSKEKTESFSQVNLLAHEPLIISTKNSTIRNVFDPQKILKDFSIKGKKLEGVINKGTNEGCLFVELMYHDLQWWEPVNIKIMEPFNVQFKEEEKELELWNNTSKKQKVALSINESDLTKSIISINPGEAFSTRIPPEYLFFGSNKLEIKYDNRVQEESVVTRNISNKETFNYEMINFGDFYNDKIPQIFRNSYLSPRSPYPTLQLPVHGIGNWCYTDVHPEIDDSGLRKLAGENNMFTIPQGVPFNCPGDSSANNIIYTSLWDNYPDEVVVPFTVRGQHMYVLMTGSTNPMQSRFLNGILYVNYEDGSKDSLNLINPDTWWPIEQDYYDDGYAFNIENPNPARLYLKSGKITNKNNEYISLKGFSERAVDGGAATILDFPLNPDKNTKSLTLKAIANDVVIGLISATVML